MGKRLVSFLLLASFVIAMGGCSLGTLPASTPGTSNSVSTSSASSQPNKPEQEKVDGEEEMIALLLSTGPLAGDGADLQYTWSPGNNTLNITQDGMHYSVERVFGSDRYWRLHGEGGYTWLVDLPDGKVLDPLAGLEQEILEYLSEVTFSPDGKYALLSYQSGTGLKLMEVDTGIKTEMPYGDVAFIRGHFLDNSTALLVASYPDPDGQFDYGLTYYDITTGTYVEQPERYTTESRNAENFMAFLVGPWAYSYPNGKLTVIDLRTFEKTEYPLDAENVTTVLYDATEKRIVATVGGIKYLLNTDGSVQEIDG